MAFTTRSDTGPLAGWNGTAVGRFWAMSGRGVGVGTAGVKTSQAASREAADPRPTRRRSWRRSTRKLYGMRGRRRRAAVRSASPPPLAVVFRLSIQLELFNCGVDGWGPGQATPPWRMCLAESDEGVDVDLIGRGRGSRGIVRARDWDRHLVLDACSQTVGLPDHLGGLERRRVQVDDLNGATVDLDLGDAYVRTPRAYSGHVTVAGERQ